MQSGNETKIFYTVSAKCKEFKSGELVVVPDDFEVWLVMNEVNKNLEWNKEKGLAEVFTEVPSKEVAMSYDKEPWYYEIKPESIRVVKTTVKVSVEVEEEDV